MSKSAQRFGPPAFAILIAFGVTAGRIPTPVLAVTAAILCLLILPLFIRHSIKKETNHE